MGNAGPGGGFFSEADGTMKMYFPIEATQKLGRLEILVSTELVLYPFPFPPGLIDVNHRRDGIYS